MRSGKFQTFRVQRTGRFAACAGAIVLAAGWSGAACAQGEGLQNLGNLSLQDLGQIVVTSVAKNPEPLGDAPAAIYVITHDEIMRSGATTLPEILRLAPNLDVMQLSPSNSIVTSRGLSGNQSAQNFPNKLLVEIDGRSVYSPLYSGIAWDTLYVLPQDIDRIEVISGPAGALWGANAVNGVINIITRSAAATQGGMVEFGVGNNLSAAALQYGGALGQATWYRFYVRDFYQKTFENGSGQHAYDGWSAPQAGFRIDHDAGNADTLMLQGDVSTTREGQAGMSDARSSHADVLGRWRHAFDDGSNFQLQMYVDRDRAWDAASSGDLVLDTFDIEAQHDFKLGEHNHVTWGLGDRVYHYHLSPDIRPDGALLWNPAVNTQNLGNAFVQDEIAVAAHLKLTLGLKAEHDPYSGWSWMPSARLAWKANPNLLLWAAASRSVRTPTAFDENVIEALPGPNGYSNFLVGNPNYLTEKLTAYELGLRAQATTRATLSVSFYYNDYADLRSIEVSPTFLPLMWGNGMLGHTYGVDLWASYSVADWWKLAAGLSEEREYFRFKPGSAGFFGASEAGDDPSHRAYVRSSMNFGSHWFLEADLRQVGALPDPRVPGYVELNARLGWQPNDRWEVSLSGMNLLHPWHLEYPSSDRIGRTVFLDTRLKF